MLHESTINQRNDMAFKRQLGERTTEAVQRCMDAGLAPAGDPALVALDLRAAVHGPRATGGRVQPVDQYVLSE